MLGRKYKNILILLISIGCCLLTIGCKVKFENFGGDLRIKYLNNGCKEVTDGINRKFLLVPEGKSPPNSYLGEIIKIPVKKVVVYSLYDIALIKKLGHTASIKAIAYRPKKWYIPEIEQGLENGKVVWLGDYTSIDFEKLRKLNPDVVFTWDESIVPTLKAFSIPCVVTSSKIAKDLDAHVNFIKFLAAFYNEEEKAKSFVKDQFEKINDISEKTKHIISKPKVIWGDIYAKKVLVEPGNSWAAQVVKKAGGEYLFSDLQGASCMQVTLEKFFARIKDADILITYRGPESGITSKEALRKSSTLLQNVDIKPLHRGKVLFTVGRLSQSPDTADIVRELASIFYPKKFLSSSRKYFFDLPQKD